MSNIRLTLMSLILLIGLYTSTVLVFGKALTPEKSSGSLIRNSSGEVIGSRLIAQAFTTDKYFHPRPSACDYNAQAASGSNLSPTNPDLTKRAEPIIAQYQASKENPIPADLVTASGSGLDPDISQAAARYQIQRVASARKVSPADIEALLPKSDCVNVLELNLALDKLKP